MSSAQAWAFVLSCRPSKCSMRILLASKSHSPTATQREAEPCVRRSSASPAIVEQRCAHIGDPPYGKRRHFSRTEVSVAGKRNFERLRKFKDAPQRQSPSTQARQFGASRREPGNLRLRVSAWWG